MNVAESGAARPELVAPVVDEGEDEVGFVRDEDRGESSSLVCFGVDWPPAIVEVGGAGCEHLGRFPCWHAYRENCCYDSTQPLWIRNEQSTPCAYRARKSRDCAKEYYNCVSGQRKRRYGRAHQPNGSCHVVLLFPSVFSNCADYFEIETYTRSAAAWKLCRPSEALHQARDPPTTLATSFQPRSPYPPRRRDATSAQYSARRHERAAQHRLGGRRGTLQPGDHLPPRGARDLCRRRRPAHRLVRFRDY